MGVALVVLVGCSSDGNAGDAASEGEGCAASVHVFVELGTSPQRERRIGEVIKDAPGVESATFHSNLEAYREFKKLYEKQPEVYKSKNPSDFPSRFEVILTSGQDYDLFERTLAGATTGIDRLVPGGCATETPR